MRIRPEALISLCAVLALLTLGLSCHPSSQETTDPEVAESEAVLAARKAREEKAAARLKAADRVPMEERFETLGEIAQLYHDTEAGGEALLGLTHLGLAEDPPGFQRVWREIDFFGGRENDRSGNQAWVGCVSLLAQVLADPRRREKVPEDQRTLIDGLQDRVEKLWFESIQGLAGREKYAQDLAVVRDLGLAFTFHKDWKAADAALARVESFSPAATPIDRVTILAERAEMWLQRAKDPEAARQRFEAAQKLIPEIKDEATRAKLANYLKERLHSTE